MSTIQNTFVRKFGNKAIIITVTDWEDFKELEKFSNESDPDFLIQSTTTKSIYTNMQPTMQLNTYSAMDITEGTHGAGLASILTSGCHNGGKNGELDKFIGGFWGFKKTGETYEEQISKL